ncbi:MAG: phosphate signaling complex protein PhoU [Anaerolineae bacterium]|nr:phosphate signaling complex protein PhoU [Gloeobacterales cyanobacterium ES-bin-313]
MLREAFTRELNETRFELLRMGTMAEKALSEAMIALVKADLAAASRVHALEESIDFLNHSINERCVRLITLQAPVAGDTRYITGILEAIVGIERIGDYADNIAEIAFALAGKPMPPLMVDFERMGLRASGMVRAALDSWAQLNRERGLAVRALDDAVDDDYVRLFNQLAKLIVAGDGSVPLNLVLACKYLERIADHAVNVAEQAAYAAPR